jgi:hypothetical protein
MSTTWGQARDVIIAAFDAMATGLDPVLPYVIDNELFNPEPPSTTSFGRLTLAEGDRQQETLGGPGARRFRTDGLARLDLYCPAERGSAKADLLIQAYRDTFEGVTLNGTGSLAGAAVYFTVTDVQRVGNEGNWYRVNCLAQFWISELK